MRGHKQSIPRPRDAPSHPSFPSRCKKALPKTSLQKKGGRRSADKRIHWSPPRRREGSLPAYAARTIAALPRKAAGSKRRRARLSAPHRGHAPRARPRLGSGPRFLESPGANGRTLPGASAASTSRSGHAPDGTMPRTARGRGVWPRFRVPLPFHFRKYPRERPLRERDEGDVTRAGTNVKGLSLQKRQCIVTLPHPHYNPSGPYTEPCHDYATRRLQLRAAFFDS